MIAQVPATSDPAMANPGTPDPGTAELQLGIAMANPGTAELQLGIHRANRFRRRPKDDEDVRNVNTPVTQSFANRLEECRAGARRSQREACGNLFPRGAGIVRL